MKIKVNIARNKSLNCEIKCLNYFFNVLFGVGNGFQALYLDSVAGCSNSLLSFGLIVLSSIRFLRRLLCCAFLHCSLLLCFSLSLNSAAGFTFPCVISLYQASLCFSKYCALLEGSASRRARYRRCFSAADICRNHGEC